MAAERQQHELVQGIRRDHVERYLFATRFVKAGDSVLDVACGCGYGSFLLANIAERVTGVDKCDKAVAFALHYYRPEAIKKRIDFVCGDACDNVGESFDVCVSFETIEHLDDAEAFMQSVRKRLKPTGYFVLSHPHRDPPGNPFHKRIFHNGEMKHLLMDRGFSIYKHFAQDATGIHEYDSTKNFIYDIWVAVKYGDVPDATPKR